jgi:dUTP pyrophosphatase
MKMNVKVLHEGTKIPKYKTEGAAWLDLVAVRSFTLWPGGHRLRIPTGVAVKIPRGYVGFVMQRSAHSLTNQASGRDSPGVIDSNYSGEICVLMTNSTEAPYDVKEGDIIAQLIVVPVVTVELVEVESLEETERGEGGFGSTGAAV